MNISYTAFIPYIIFSAIAFGTAAFIGYVLWTGRRINGTSHLHVLFAFLVFAIGIDILLGFAPYLLGLASRPITSRPGPSRWFTLGGRTVVMAALCALARGMFTRKR